MTRKPYEIIYSSDITIEDPYELSSLCVFYDRVVLPHVSDSTVDEISFDLSDTHQTVEILRELSKGHFPKRVEGWHNARTWDERNRILFDKGVIVRLEPPRGESQAFDEDLFFDMSAEDQLVTLTRMKNWELDISGDEPMLAIRPDIIQHLCRNDLSSPELHVCGGQPASREVMKFLEAQSVFSYVLPKLKELEPEEILRIRESVEARREGFAFHLQKLSKGVEERLQGGESLAEIERFAKSVVETEVMPDYVEFRRALHAVPRGRWGKVVEIAGSVLSIDANPLTPKFWGQLLTIIGAQSKFMGMRQETPSNQKLAFQFMKSIEDNSSA
jgi:hypothetical protein